MSKDDDIGVSIGFARPLLGPQILVPIQVNISLLSIYQKLNSQLSLT
jgi:hypothetical protein